MRRAGAMIVLLTLVLVGIAAPSFGTESASVAMAVEPPEGGAEAGQDGEIIVGVGTPGEGESAAPVGTPDPGTDKERACRFGGNVIDCESQFGVWDGRCYVEVADPQPSKDDDVWAGHDDGVIVVCMPYICVPQPGQDTIPVADCPGRSVYWAPRAPDSDVDPAVLAERAVDRMQLQPIDIGIVPEDKPGSVGIVGMPQWMWVNEPAPNTFGPITASASAGGHTVTATASVDKVVWDMGDGNTVTCVGAGTPYEDRFDIADSPDCGHRYTKQGEYEVTATSYWTVEWDGIGQTGIIPVERTNSTNIVMGEAQVITQ
ncbi:hypothetical protein [Promicromonospora sp. NPDC023987]|uniref:hypothetical protein n=1 Tax=Promicromonospora sp. NPDC023987 TaxID=3155360 RepID=UPI0033D0B8CD